MISILKKVIEELEKELPRLDYIRGMVETLVEMQTPESKNNVVVNNIPKSGTSTQLDEAAVLDATAKAAIASVKALAESSQE